VFCVELEVAVEDALMHVGRCLAVEFARFADGGLG
jgi:hypothetical protein